MFLSNAKRIFILIFLLGMTPAVSSEETWIVEDIRISGLQRISAGSIFSSIPITIGEKDNIEDIQNITIVTRTSCKSSLYGDPGLPKEHIY